MSSTSAVGHHRLTGVDNSRHDRYPMVSGCGLRSAEVVLKLALGARQVRGCRVVNRIVAMTPFGVAAGLCPRPRRP
jgi:hypothetical protein